jgi:hypothetical protein
MGQVVVKSLAGSIQGHPLLKCPRVQVKVVWTSGGIAAQLFAACWRPWNDCSTILRLASDSTRHMAWSREVEGIAHKNISKRSLWE